MHHFLQSTLILSILTLLASCAAPTQIVKTNTVTIPKLVLVPLDPALTAPCDTVEPLPTTGPMMLPGVFDWAVSSHEALVECDGRMAKIRSLQPTPPGKTNTATH